MNYKIIKSTVTNILFVIAHIVFWVGLFRFINLIYPIEATYFIKHIVVFFIPSCINTICFDILKGLSYFYIKCVSYEHDAFHNKKVAINKLIACTIVICLALIFKVFMFIGIYRYICLLSPIDLITYIKIISTFVLGIIINECNKYIQHYSIEYILDKLKKRL